MKRRKVIELSDEETDDPFVVPAKTVPKPKITSLRERFQAARTRALAKPAIVMGSASDDDHDDANDQSTSS